MKPTAFGAQLESALSEAVPFLGMRRSQRISALAAELHVTNSLVHKWLRGNRIPSLQSGHVARIAAMLRLDYRSRARLEQAQVAALSVLDVTPRRTKSTRRRTIDAVHALVEARSHALPARELTAGALRTTPRDGNARVFRHRADALRLAIAALNEAPACDPPETQTIVITSQSAESWWSSPETADLRRAWRLALWGVLQRGWLVRHAWRLHQVERSLRLVETTFEMAAFDGYQPCYFTQYGMLRPPYDVLVIPEHAALLFLSTTSPDSVDAGLHLRDRAEIQLLQTHAEQQLSLTKDLFQRFRAPDQEMAFTRAMVESEAKPGGRVLVKNGLSALTTPPSWLVPSSEYAQRIAASGAVSASDLAQYFKLLRDRWHTFERNIRLPANSYFDICPRSALEQLLEHGVSAADAWQIGEVLPRPRVLERVRHVLAMLRRFEHYHLALVDETTARAFSAQSTWSVTGGAVNFSLPALRSETTGDQTQINLSIAEPHILSAFRDYFMTLWHERIAPEDADKSKIIPWLETYVHMLEDPATARRTHATP